MESELGFLVSVVIICADITATVLGIEAEIAQSKTPYIHHHQHQHLRHSECRRTPSAGAFAEGVAAMVLLFIVHVLANVLGGCTCIRSKQDFNRATANKILAVAFLFLSWVFFLVSYTALMLGTLANSKSNRFCNLPHHWFFAIGAIFSLGHGLVTSAYYVSAIAAKKEDKEKDKPEPNLVQEGLKTKIKEMARVVKVDSAESWKFYISQAKNQGCPIVAHFTASWCIPSVFMNSFFEELAISYKDALFLIVDVDEVKEVASKLEVKAMPTFLFLKDGNVMDKLVGANPDEIKKRVDGFVQSSRVAHVA